MVVEGGVGTKKFSLLCVQLLLCFCFATVAIADSADVIYVKCPDDFEIQSIDVSEDGTFLLAGSTGKLLRLSPLIMSVNTSGEVLWSLKPKTKAKYDFYRVATYLDDGTILSQHSVSVTPSRWVFEWIRDGQIIHKMKPAGDVFGVCPVPNGFLAFSDGKTPYTTRITRMDLKGQSLWKIDFDENLSYADGGMITRDGVHVVYASKIVRENEDKVGKYMSVMLAIDDQGKQLWRHDSTGPEEEFLDAAWTDDGNVVALGNANGCFIAEYDSNGQLWRKGIRYMSNDVDSYYIFGAAILPVANGYLVAQDASSVNGKARMLLIDRAGNIVKEWLQPLGDVFLTSQISLHRVGDDVYLVANGRAEPEDLYDDEVSIADLSLLTVLVRIDLTA